MTSRPLVFEEGTPVATGLEGAGTARLFRVVLFVFSIGIPTDVMLASRIGGSSSLILGAPLAAAVAWQVVTTGRFRPLTAPLLALSAFVAWAALSIFWAAKPEWVVKSVTTYAQLLAFVWLAWQLLRTEADVRASLLGFLSGCTIIVAEQWQSFLAGRTTTGGEIWEGGARYVAEGFDPNDTGVTLAIGIPIATYLLLTSARRTRYLMFAYFPVATSGLGLTGSRGSTITALVAVLAVIAWIGRRSRALFGLALAAIAGSFLLAWSYVPWDSWARLVTIRDQLARGSLGDRAPIWSAGLDLVLEHPLVGVGSGGFADAVIPALRMHITAHNTPLLVATELGAVGVALFYAAHGLAFRSLARAATDRRALALSLLITWFVGCTSLSWATRKTTWFIVLCMMVLGSLRPAKPTDHGPRPETP